MSFDDSNIVPFGQISSAKNTVGHGGDPTVEEILDFAGNYLENALVIGEDARVSRRLLAVTVLRRAQRPA